MAGHSFVRRVSAIALATAVVLTVGQSPASHAGQSRPRVEVAPSVVGSGSIVVSATLPGSQAGRAVALERKSGTKWVKVRSSRVPRNGWVQFLVPSKASSTWLDYRIKAMSYRGLASIASVVVNGRSVKKVFGDEFTGSQVNKSKWAVRLPGKYFGLRQCSASERVLPKVANGKVLLQVKKSPTKKAACKNGVFVNTMIGTQESFSSKYGTFAARIKFSPYRGQHASFWLQGASEIDVAEFFGLGRKDSGLTAFVHWDNQKVGGIRNLRGILPRGKNPANSYHVYSVDWTPTRYVFRIDGKVILNTTRGVSDVAQYMILSNLTSDWENGQLDKRKLPTATYVDWVRVWRSN